jgi:hypothetical protein
MKYFLIAVAIFTVFPSLANGQTCEQTAKELESKISKITQDLDKAAFGKFVADDALFILADGSTANKKKQAESFPKLPSNIVFSLSSEDIKIRTCGETSIITTGKDIISAVNKSSKETGTQNYWFTRIYEKRQGSWQLIFNQLTSTNE